MDIQMDYATVLTLCSSVSFVLILKLLSCLFIHHSRLVDTLQGEGGTSSQSIVLLCCCCASCHILHVHLHALDRLCTLCI